MQPQFKPPQTEEEFQERARALTLPGARAVLNTLRERRKALVEAIDQEIAFYQRVVEIKSDGPELSSPKMYESL